MTAITTTHEGYFDEKGKPIKDKKTGEYIYKFQNSWGASWGKYGRFSIRVSDEKFQSIPFFNLVEFFNPVKIDVPSYEFSTPSNDSGNPMIYPDNFYRGAGREIKKSMTTLPNNWSKSVNSVDIGAKNNKLVVFTEENCKGYQHKFEGESSWSLVSDQLYMFADNIKSYYYNKDQVDKDCYMIYEKACMAGEGRQVCDAEFDPIKEGIEVKSIKLGSNVNYVILATQEENKTYRHFVNNDEFTRGRLYNSEVVANFNKIQSISLTLKK